MTPYYENTGIKDSTWIYVNANDVPQAADGYKAGISFNGDGALVTSDAGQVFPAAVNNKSAGIAWWGIIGRERKFIAGTGSATTDLGTVTFSPGKNLLIGGKKFATKVTPCTYICSYRDVDCCPTINSTWAVTDGAGNAAGNPAYFAVSAAAGRWKVTKTKGGSDSVDSAVYGAGLAGISAAANEIFWVSGSNNTMMYSSDYRPLFELVDVSELLSPTYKIVIKPAVTGAANITLERKP